MTSCAAADDDFYITVPIFDGTGIFLKWHILILFLF
jgi:hypothetical protein